MTVRPWEKWSTPMPTKAPEQGWSLEEAAEALFPEHWSFLWSQDDFHWRLRALGTNLLRAIVGRPDLALSGRDLSRLPVGQRVAIPRELFVTNTLFDLDIAEGSLKYRLDQTWQRLHAVRVERSVETMESHCTETKIHTPMKGSSKKSVSGLNYAEQDAPLVQEIIRQFRALPPEEQKQGTWKITEKIAEQAAGKPGSVSSKAKRLHKRVTKELAIQTHPELDKSEHD